jgi:hypothetical protein
MFVGPRIVATFRVLDLDDLGAADRRGRLARPLFVARGPVVAVVQSCSACSLLVSNGAILGATRL